MSDTQTFVYVIYIAAPLPRVWRALLDGELTRQYWKHENVSDWKPGSRWAHVSADGERATRLEGTVIECVPEQRLALTWGEPGAARRSRVVLELQAVGDMVRLTVTHDELEGAMHDKVSAGWPRVLSSLKSLLETGKALATWA